MRWPQWVMLTIYVMTLYYGIRDTVRDKRKSHRDQVVTVYAYIIYVAVVAYVLHAGGFW